MIPRPVSSIFLCSPLPSGTWNWKSSGLSIPWCCLPTFSSLWGQLLAQRPRVGPGEGWAPSGCGCILFSSHHELKTSRNLPHFGLIQFGLRASQMTSAFNSQPPSSSRGSSVQIELAWLPFPLSTWMLHLICGIIFLSGVHTQLAAASAANQAGLWWVPAAVWFLQWEARPRLHTSCLF